jgi:hypothetical protein
MKRAWAIESRRLAKPALAASRLGWRALLIAARELARGDGVALAPGARRVSFEARLLDFRHLLREARPEHFQVEGASVALLCEGFVRVGRGFAETTLPEIRAEIGPALLACADALLNILDEARAAQAREHNRRIMGERED